MVDLLSAHHVTAEVAGTQVRILGEDGDEIASVPFPPGMPVEFVLDGMVARVVQERSGGRVTTWPSPTRREPSDFTAISLILGATHPITRRYNVVTAPSS